MELSVVAPKDGEQVSERVRILFETDQLVVTESVYAPGDAGPGPHIHRRHADTFWVLGGRLVFELGREAERFDAPAETFIGAPPGVVHTFRNEGPEDARFLNFHAPGCEFGRYLRDLVAGRNTGWFDTEPPPADGGPPAAAVLFVPPDEGERVSGTVVKAVRPELQVAQVTLERGAERTPSAPTSASRHLFAVAEGKLAIDTGDHYVEAAPGTYVCVAATADPSITATGSTPVRLLHVVAPGAR